MEFTSYALCSNDFSNTFQILSHHSTLQSLKVTSNTSIPLLPAVTPLLRILGLRILEIGGSVSISEITNADISNIVSAWPGLQRLLLPTEVHNGQPGATLSCLIPLSTLPKLEELRIRLTVGVAKIPLHYGDRLNHHLQSLFSPHQLQPHFLPTAQR